MPTMRLSLQSVTCDRTSSSGGDQVALCIYEGSEDSPSRIVWRSGEEAMDQGDRWDIEGVTPNFSGTVWVSVVELEDDGSINFSYGRFAIDAATDSITPANLPLSQMVQGRGCYTIVYSLIAAAPTESGSAGSDPDLEPDLTMLGNGGDAPLTRRLDAIKAQAAAADATVFHNLVLQLANLCREATKRFEKKRLGEHLRDSSESDDEKTERIGNMVRDAARIEFLLGWMYLKGYSTTNNWETQGSNKGPFVNVYLEEHGITARNSSALRLWCTMFNGAPYRWLGFHVINGVSQRLEKSIFLSGYRIQRWARHGKNHSSATVGDSINEDEGGYLYTRQRSSRWYSALSSVPNLVTWKNLWDDMQANGKKPQPGDIILIANYKHTVMVDDVEESGDDFHVYTIEGNAGHGSRSRKLTVSDATIVDTYKQKRRRCLASNTARCVAPVSGDASRSEWRRRFGIALVRPGWDNMAADSATSVASHVTTEEISSPPPGGGAAAPSTATQDDSSGSGDASGPPPVAAPAGTSNVIELGNLAAPGELLTLILGELKAFMGDASLSGGPWIQNPTEDRVWAWCGKPTNSPSIQ